MGCRFRQQPHHTHGRKAEVDGKCILSHVALHTLFSAILEPSDTKASLLRKKKGIGARGSSSSSTSSSSTDTAARLRQAMQQRQQGISDIISFLIASSSSFSSSSSSSSAAAASERVRLFTASPLASLILGSGTLLLETSCFLSLLHQHALTRHRFVHRLRH